MAKILVLLNQTVIDNNNPYGLLCFYESMVKELCNNGNDVKVLNLALYKRYNDDYLRYLTPHKRNLFYSEVKNFNPDVVFTYNNQIFKDIFKLTDCPICIFDADSVDFFPCKEYVKLYTDRYYLFTFFPEWEDYKYTQLGLKKGNIFQLNLATSIKNVKMEKTKNISFIGTNFPPIPENIVADYSNLTKKDLYNILIEYWTSEKYNTNKLKELYPQYASSIGLYSFWDTRLVVLNSILDLGLNLYGKFWNNLPSPMFQLKLTVDDSPMYSLEHNQCIYNSSKINLSISHPQCDGYAFPWRIYDIMASNGLLITSCSELLKKKTEGFVDLPMYDNPYEAKALCKYALNNPSYCEDVIEQSNQFIDKFARWDNNFKIIQDSLKLNILSNVKKTNQNFEVYQLIDSSVLKYKRTKKTDFKNFINGLLLALSAIPLINILFTKKLKNKLINSIVKYNNSENY